MTDKLDIKINSKDFRVPPDKKVDLSKWPTVVDPVTKSKKEYKQLLEQHMEKLASLQHLHYASHKYALLLVFQGMDGAGKDGAIRHVMSGVNPEGCEVFSFKQSSVEELEHDFYGAPHAASPNAARSAYSIVPTTRKRWSFGCILRFSEARGFRKSYATRKPSGKSGIAPS